MKAETHTARHVKVGRHPSKMGTVRARPHEKPPARRRPMAEVKPRLIAFEITRRCRYRCKHCRADADADTTDVLTTGQCKKIITSLARFAKPILILTGGEPMERPDLYEIIEHARQRGLRVVMATCGYLLDDESMARLKKAGLSAMAFSIDGSSAETHDRFREAPGAFDTVLKAVESAKRSKMPFQLNTTLSKLNSNEILGIAELAKRLGAICFDVFIMVPTGRGGVIEDAVLDPVEYETLLGELLRIKLKGGVNVRVTCGPTWSRVCRQAKVRGLTDVGKGCMAGRGFGFISWRGDVQTCGFLDVSAGNLVKNGFKFREIWLKSRFLNEIRDLSAYKGKCGECEYVGVCGGCRARAMTMLGDYLAEDPICGYVPRLRDTTPGRARSMR